MLRFLLADTNRTPLEIIKTSYGGCLAVARTAETQGVFKSTNRTTTGTSIITAPDSGGAIVLTDLLISTDKVNNATVVVRFTDGTNTIEIFSANVTDAPVNLSIPFAGNWKGWKNARLELVTVNTVDVTVAVGYYKIGNEFADGYTEWDAKR